MVSTSGGRVETTLRGSGGANGRLGYDVTVNSGLVFDVQRLDGHRVVQELTLIYEANDFVARYFLTKVCSKRKTPRLRRLLSQHHGHPACQDLLFDHENRITGPSLDLELFLIHELDENVYGLAQLWTLQTHDWRGRCI